MMILLVIFFVVFVTSSIESIYAEITPKYLVHIQVEVRNAQEQLVSITESRLGEYMHYEIPDYVFDSTISQKEIITVGKIKYEKVQFEISSESSDMEDSPSERKYGNNLRFSLCGTSEHDKFTCINLQSARYFVLTESGDVVISKWTVLRMID